MSTFLHKNSAIGIRLEKFGLALKASPPLFRRSQQFIFLCGANQSDNVPSARRKALKTFIQQNSVNSTVIYAEGVFNELQKFGRQKNALDLEHKIAKIADKVIIILESHSACCELGAFAHEKLREKLIVINDSQFKSVPSFINLGPIAALEEAKSPVVWYPMSHNGISVLDGIGAAFPEILKSISHAPKVGVAADYLGLSNLDMDRACLFFVHDLVLLSGPVSHRELVEVLKKIFGDKEFDALKSHLGMLRESGLVKSWKTKSGEWIYRTSTTDLFLKYKVDVSPLLAAFRCFHLKENTERFLNE